MIDWYFDFVSPYSYLQFGKLRDLPASTVQLRPVLFAGLLNHWGNLGPAEIPSKRRYTYQSLLWQARQQNTVLRFPPRHPFNPLRALRLAIALGSTHDAIGTIFRFVWLEGRDVDDPNEWAELSKRLGVDADQLVADPQVKEALKRNTDEAIAAGVFGVPTAVVAGRLFWGNDSTPLLRAFLADPTLFDDPEYERVGDLPYGAARR